MREAIEAGARDENRASRALLPPAIAPSPPYGAGYLTELVPTPESVTGSEFRMALLFVIVAPLLRPGRAPKTLDPYTTGRSRQPCRRPS